jgi:cyclic pyranopterin phosphate synthase
MDFTHLDKETNNPRMVDVGPKSITSRSAHARSVVMLDDLIMEHFTGKDFSTKKGPVFHTAIIAGTMAVKRTWELIPFCHPLAIEQCNIDITVNEKQEVVIDCHVSVTARTGVEMEALTGASVAALTIYDMCKSISKEMVIKETRLIEKKGGKSDYKK